MIRFYILEWIYQTYPWAKVILPYVTAGWLVLYLTIIVFILKKKGFE